VNRSVADDKGGRAWKKPEKLFLGKGNVSCPSCLEKKKEGLGYRRGLSVKKEGKPRFQRGERFSVRRD